MIGKARPDRGLTGFGTLLLLAKKNSIWKVEKSRLLWEE